MASLNTNPSGRCQVSESNQTTEEEVQPLQHKPFATGDLLPSKTIEKEDKQIAHLHVHGGYLSKSSKRSICIHHRLEYSYVVELERGRSCAVWGRIVFAKNLSSRSLVLCETFGKRLRSAERRRADHVADWQMSLRWDFSRLVNAAPWFCFTHSCANRSRFSVSVCIVVHKCHQFVGQLVCLTN